MKPRLVLAFAALLFWPAATLAGPASDLVRTFYAPVGFEADPKLRDRFVDPARSILDQYDRSSSGGTEVGCIDFVLAIDAQDFDQGEINRTLVFDESVSGDTTTVTATFKVFPDDPMSRRKIEWSLKQVDGAWKIADIASRAHDWRLSTFDCR